MKRVRTLKVGFLFGIAVMLANAVVPYQTLVWLERAGEATQRTEDAQTLLSEFLSSLKDVETGQRGFIITGQDAFLEPYTQGTAEAEVRLKSLQGFWDEPPAQRQRFERLHLLTEEHRAALREAIDLRRTQGLA